MKPSVIQRIEARDVRFPLPSAAGTDAVHSGSEYAYAVTLLRDAGGRQGCGLALTLGTGNKLVCDAIQLLAEELKGLEIEELMSEFGVTFHKLAEHPQLRWLGPHKGVVHLALASITNACFDLWAKARGVPLWRLLLNLSPEQIVALADFSYLEEVLTPAEALSFIKGELPNRPKREAVLHEGYPGYDTSVGWFQYEDAKIRDGALRALEQGFRAFKLKVGSTDGERDVRRAFLLRDALGPDVRIMLDVNQQWTLPRALEMCKALLPMSPYWIEEPTHPDDVSAHKTIADAISPVPVALGEHVPNRVVFKNFMQAGAVQLVQVDCTRVGGVSEFIAVSLLARKFGLPVVPHVGDMGQVHQHLVMFNHIALGHEKLFLEYIPHLKEHFAHPAVVSDGVYHCPQDVGSSSDLKDLAAN
ncbi:MAG TPA: enolase C-terminal domain-like protein [Terriglobia bacterium]|nr:enolase C-terminal domain-like protein [Terriglobia bacterium]